MAFKRGSRIRFTARFQNAITRQPADPSQVTFEIQYGGAGTITTKAYPADAEVVRDGVGKFHIDHDVVGDGELVAVATGTGAVVCSDNLHVIVEPSPLAT